MDIKFLLESRMEQRAGATIRCESAELPLREAGASRDDENRAARGRANPCLALERPGSSGTPLRSRSGGA